MLIKAIAPALWQRQHIAAEEQAGVLVQEDFAPGTNIMIIPPCDDLKTAVFCPSHF